MGMKHTGRLSEPCDKMGSVGHTTWNGRGSALNEKDTAALRRHMKPEQERLKIFDLLNVYVMKETSEIYHRECRPFAMLDLEEQTLFVTTFKKVLTGAFDHKLFELKFRPEPAEGQQEHTQTILYEALQADGSDVWTDRMMQMTDKMLADHAFEHDTVISFARGQFWKPVKRREEETEESEREEAHLFRFILCTVNRTEQPPKNLVFDYIGKAFKPSLALDPIVKLSAPEAGFLFPCLTDDASDVNHVLYAAGKPNEPDYRFIEEVLNSQRKATAREDKEMFEEIVRDVAGDALDASTLAGVYGEIRQLIEENEDPEPPMLDSRDVERILTASGVDGVSLERVEEAFEQAADDPRHELKASNVIPKFTSKSIKINTSIATITISPEHLQHLRQVRYQGKRCLLIEVDEDTVIEGFTMKTEPLQG